MGTTQEIPPSLGIYHVGEIGDILHIFIRNQVSENCQRSGIK